MPCTYLQEAAMSLPRQSWLDNGAYRVEDGDGYVVARYIMGQRGIVWSVIHESRLPGCRMSDVFEAIERRKFNVYRLDRDGQSATRAIQLDRGGI